MYNVHKLASEWICHSDSKMPFEIAALVAGTVLGLMAPSIKSFCDWVAGKNAASGMTIVDDNRYVVIPKLYAL